MRLPASSPFRAVGAATCCWCVLLAAATVAQAHEEASKTSNQRSWDAARQHARARVEQPQRPELQQRGVDESANDEPAQSTGKTPATAANEPGNAMGKEVPELSCSSSGTCISHPAIGGSWWLLVLSHASALLLGAALCSWAHRRPTGRCRSITTQTSSSSLRCDSQRHESSLLPDPVGDSAHDPSTAATRQVPAQDLDAGPAGSETNSSFNCPACSVAGATLCQGCQARQGSGPNREPAGPGPDSHADDGAAAPQDEIEADSTAVLPSADRRSRRVEGSAVHLELQFGRDAGATQGMGRWSDIAQRSAPATPASQHSPGGSLTATDACSEGRQASPSFATPAGRHHAGLSEGAMPAPPPQRAQPTSSAASSSGAPQAVSTGSLAPVSGLEHQHPPYELYCQHNPHGASRPAIVIYPEAFTHVLQPLAAACRCA